MANPHSGHKRGLGAPLVVVALLVCGAAAGVHYSAPVEGDYRAVVPQSDEAPPLRVFPGEYEYAEQAGVLYLRVRLRRRYPVLGTWEWADRWDRAAFEAFRRDHPTLAAREDYWPDATAPDGGVAWTQP